MAIDLNDKTVNGHNLTNVNTVVEAFFLNDTALKAYYRFSEVSGTTAADSTANSHPGTASRSNILNNVGKFGNGAVFASASSDKISITNHADFRPTTAFSISAWVKTSTSAYQAIFNSYQQNSAVAGFQFEITDTGKLTLLTGKNTGTNQGAGDFNNIVGNTSINDGNWHHVVGVWTGTHLRVYVDGVEDATAVSWSTAPAYNASNSVRIGANEYVTGSLVNDYFNGSIDDVAFFSKALNLAEIALLSGSTNDLGSTMDTPFTNSTIAIDLESGSTQYLTTPDASDLSISTTSRMTFELWAKVETLSDNNYVISKNAASNFEYRIAVGDAGGGIDINVFSLDGNNRYFTGSVGGLIAVGVWNHIAITVDDSGAWASTNVHIYKNGVEVSYASQIGNSLNTLANGTAALELGRYSPTSLYFDGLIDEVRLWNTIRTPTQISNNMSLELGGNESGLVAYYPFEAPIGTTTSTSSSTTTTSTSSSTSTTTTSTSSSTSTTTTITSTSTTITTTSSSTTTTSTSTSSSTSSSTSTTLTTTSTSTSSSSSTSTSTTTTWQYVGEVEYGEISQGLSFEVERKTDQL